MILFQPGDTLTSHRSPHRRFVRNKDGFWNDQMEYPYPSKFINDALAYDCVKSEPDYWLIIPVGVLVSFKYIAKTWILG